jgi:adenylate cyclase
VSDAAAWAVAGAAAAVALAALAALARTRRESARVGERLSTVKGELERLENAFARFAPSQVVERIIASGVPTVGERKEVTVLFADLVGFTPLAESVDPVVLVRILNGYFERMSRAITANQGHISTLIGDGILALFGALEPNPWQANDAAQAALAMRDELAAFNRELAADGLPELAIGVGLHRGIGIAGLVGSRDVLQMTVVGTVVNVAARVEALTRELEADVLLTRAVAETLDPRFELRPLPAREVKGVSEPVETFALIGRRERGAEEAPAGTMARPRAARA